MNEKTVAELEARAAEIDGMDFAEMTAELAEQIADEREAIVDELESRKAAAAAEAERRAEVAEAAMPAKPIIEETRNEKMDRNSAEYRVAWLHYQMGKVTPEERQILDTVNAELRSGESMTSATAAYAIPMVTANRVVENLVQLYPLIGEIELLQIPGNVSIAVEDTVNAAAIHTENASITPADDTLTRVVLSGYEIVKLLSVSAKLNAMEIDAFEDWIVSNLTRKIGEVIENYIVNGTGSSQPKGLEKYATWTDGTNAVDWASTAPTAAELIEQISYLNAAYVGNAKFLMNWKTFWNKVYGLRDDKNPGIVNDTPAVQGDGLGGYRVFGFPVLLSAKVADDTIFFGDFHEAIVANMAAPISVESDKSSGFRYNAIDYRGACVFDCTTVGAGRVVKSASSLS